MENNKIKDAIFALEKKFGKNTIIGLDDDGESTSGIKFVSSGSITLDNALGGGYARGRVIEIFGPESSGKTTLTLHAIAEVQKEGGVAAFIDMEHAFDRVYAQNLGVDISKESLLFSQPSNGEQAFDIAETLIRTGEIDIVVIDSVAALTPKAEIEGDFGDSKMGLQARLMSQALRKLTSIVGNTDTILFFTNQLREKIGVMFGNPETTTGGNALKFYASQRLDIRRININKDGDEAISNRVKVKVIKNKTAPPFRVAEFDIIYGEGIDKLNELIQLSVELGVIKKSGSWYSYEDTKLGQGIEQVKKIILDNPELLGELEVIINKNFRK